MLQASGNAQFLPCFNPAGIEASFSTLLIPNVPGDQMSNDSSHDEVDELSSLEETERDTTANGLDGSERRESQDDQAQAGDPTLTERVLDFVDRYRRVAREVPTRVVAS